MERWLAHELARRDVSLVGFWPLGVGLQDHSGHEHHATPNNNGGFPWFFNQRVASRGGRRGAHIWQPTMMGGYAWLEVPHSSDYAFGYSDPFTISCWVWRDADDNVSAPYPLLSKMDYYGDTGWEVLLTGTGAIQVKISGWYTYGYALQVTSEDAVTQEDCWCHVVIAYDGSSNAAGFRIYVNGRQVNFTTDYNFPVSNPANSDVIKMGARTSGGGGTGNLQGLMQLARIYRRELPDREVRHLHHRETRAEWHRPLSRKAYSPNRSLGLFVSGYATQSGGLTLSVDGSDGTIWRSSLALFTDSSLLKSDVLDFYTSAAESESLTTTLFTVAWEAALPTTLPLTVMTDAVPLGSSELSLFLSGHEFDGNGVEGNISLFTSSDGQQRLLPLFLQTSDSDRGIRNINLWTKGVSHATNDSLDLFIQNEQSGVHSAVSIYVSGDGTNPGWTPYSREMNLVLVRDPANAITLFTAGPGTVADSGLDLFVGGGYVSSGVLDLSIPEVLGFATKDAKLYTHGF